MKTKRKASWQFLAWLRARKTNPTLTFPSFLHELAQGHHADLPLP